MRDQLTWRVNHLIYAAGKDLHNTIRTRIAMTEPIDADALREAADSAITRYPYFSVMLIRSGETYVLAYNDAPLTISSGGMAIPLGGSESGYHLLALAYDGNLLYIDTSHFLTDGNGKFPFIKTLLYCYLHILHPEAVFDTSGIAMPGSDIPFAEADDYPFLDQPFQTAPLGSVPRRKEAFTLEDQPVGYESRGQWTSFRMKIKQKEMMNYASTVDGSPATFLSSVMYRVIDEIHPDHRLPIVCGMQHQYRKALGKPYSHLCHVNVYPIVYTDRMRGRSIELLNVMARGTTIIRADEANDRLAIEVKGLKKSFGSLEVLKGVDLSVAQGERIAIIGGSGCGKSVFLRSLCLLEKPDAGQVFIDGQEITAAKGGRVDEIRRSMGMVFQKFHLFSEMDVMDNLCLAPTRILKMSRANAEKKAMDLLAQVGLASRAHAWPTVLSGGQQQRIAICRCLMMEPKVLLFDEPTSALDPTMVGEVLAVIRMLAKRDMSMLIVTHEMNFAREVASRVLFFADGGIYEQGTPAEIFDAPKREKTVAFIHKIKYFSFEIRERGFDLMQLQGGIQTFGEKYGLSLREINRLQICCEELLYEMLDNCYGKGGPVEMKLDVSYAETDHMVEIALACGGAAYDPFEQAKDGLGVTILKNMAKQIDCRRKGERNRITITL